MNDVIVVEDPRLLDVVEGHAALRQLADGCTWSEGPVYLPGEDAVLWSDIPANRIMRWSPNDGASVYRNDVEYTNGHTLDLEGRLVSCSHGNRRIERTEADGTITALVTHFEGRRLNSPNDVVVASDGAIWFSDPPYGIASDHEGHAADSEIDRCHVFRFDPATGELAAMTDGVVVEEPNGLAFSPDETVLYVADTSAALRTDGGGNHHVMAFDVGDGWGLERPRVFAEVEPGLADGFRITDGGVLITSAGDGLHVYAPDGTRLGKILVPEVVSNCAFGGTSGRTLFITASTSLYAIELRVGSAVPARPKMGS